MCIANCGTDTTEHATSSDAGGTVDTVDAGTDGGDAGIDAGDAGTDDAEAGIDLGDAGTDAGDGDAGDGDGDGGNDAGGKDACKDGETQSCYSGPSGTQGVGTCVAGTKTCVGGVFGPCVGEVTPQTESCDGLDNDCDETPDDGNPGGNEACTTGYLGVCSAGTSACKDGKIVCNWDVGPIAESCDGYDNDCNGFVDDGDAEGGKACDTSLFGECAVGKTACEDGKLVCQPQLNPGAKAETCDGFDNDCDDVVDNGVCGP